MRMRASGPIPLEGCPVVAVAPNLRTLSLLEAVKETGIPETTIRTLVRTRKIPYIKVGKYLRFEPEALRAWLDAGTVPALNAQARAGR